MTWKHYSLAQPDQRFYALVPKQCTRRRIKLTGIVLHLRSSTLDQERFHPNKLQRLPWDDSAPVFLYGSSREELYYSTQNTKR